MPAKATRVDAIEIEQVGEFKEDHGAVRARVSGECEVKNVNFALPPQIKTFDCRGEFHMLKNEFGEWSASINTADTGPVCAGPAQGAAATTPHPSADNAAPRSSSGSADSKTELVPTGRKKRHAGDLVALLETCRDAPRDRCSAERVERFLAEGADPNYQKLPLRLALVYGLSREVIKVLIEYGADVSSAENLVLAAGDPVVTQMLLDAGTPVNGVADPPFNSKTALMEIAAMDPHIDDAGLEALRFLINAGADPKRRSGDGKTAHDFALARLTELEEAYKKEYPDGNMPDHTVGVLAKRRKIVDYLKSVTETKTSSAPSRTEKPFPTPFIVRDVCPWEGCNFGRWLADESVHAYATEGETDRVAFEIAKDEGVQVETGNVWVHRPGLVRITSAATLKNPEGRTQRPLVLSSGETLFVLTHLGEGRYRVWRDGIDYLVQGCWTSKTSSRPNPCGEMVEEGEREWWVRVRNDAGTVGWLKLKLS